MIRLMNDYTVEWPLWGEDGMLDRSDLAVDPILTERLELWASLFNHYFDPDSGWPARELAQFHRQLGEQLARELENSLGEGNVQLQYWETSVRGKD